MRICFLAGTLGQGGAEQQLYYMVRALQQAGTPVRVLCLTRGEFWEPRIQSLGVPVTWVGRSRSRVARLGAVISDLRRTPADILQSQHFYASPYAVVAARVVGIREIGAIRCDAFTESRDNGAVMGRFSLRAPRIIAANSEAGIQNAIASGVRPSRLYLLPNVVDTERYTVSPPRTAGPVTLLSIGRLSEQKRVDRFLTLLQILKDKHSRAVRGLVVGDGPQRAELEARARTLGLSPGTVEFRGIVPSTESIYHEADILLLTSDYEGTPNVVLEAMASGLPVVANRVGDVPSLISDHATGYLVDAGDDSRALEALLRLIDDRSLRRRIGQNARHHVEEHFSVQNLSRVLGGLYATVLGPSYGH